MINNAIAFLVLLPMLAGIVCALVRNKPQLQRSLTIISLIGSAVLAIGLLVAIPDQGFFVSFAGGWPAPFGIAIAFDAVSGVLIAAASLVALACGLHAIDHLPRRTERTWFHPLLHLQMMGINFSFLTADLFNLFVAFEIMLMASYALLCLGGGERQVQQAYKYVTLNLVASAVFVIAAGFVYGLTGTLNFAGLAQWVARQPAGEIPPAFSVLAVLLLFVFAAKGALFPLWFWLPDAYPTMPASLAGLFAALLSKVGVYAILRLFPLVFAAPGTAMGGTHSVAIDILGVGAVLTMVLAILGAMGSHQMKRILALVLISHVGYLAFGIWLGLKHNNPDALSASLFYMMQEMIVMAGLFLCVGLIERRTGSDDLHKIGGLLPRAPWLAALTMLLILAMAGVPPLPGFVGKILFIREGVSAGAWIATSAYLLASILTLIVALRMWARAFWFPPRTADDADLPQGAELNATPERLGFTGVWVLAGALIACTIAAEPLLQTIGAGTRMLLEPSVYVETVLGPGAWPAEPIAALDATPGLTPATPHAEATP